MYEIAVLDYRHDLEVQKQIQAFASNTIDFPTERCPENERIDRTGTAEIVLATTWEKIDADYLNSCPNLKYVGLCGTSTANVDLEELERRGIAFSNIVSDDKESVAEYFFMMLVQLTRGAGDYQWRSGNEHELLGRTMGIIGLGKVGQAMAHMALAYKMNVIYFSPNRKQTWEDKGLRHVKVNELVASSDITVICSTTDVVVLDAKAFTAMKPKSILVQASGGSPFDIPAFFEWIDQDGNFALFDMSAGVQNYERYKDLPRVIFSTAVAGDTYETDARRGRSAVKNLKKFIQNDSSN